MSIAVSGTRHKLSTPWEHKIEAVLRPYEGLQLHVGDCPTGVDTFVKRAYPNAIVFEATGPWPNAGPIRNGRMLRGCTVLLAFPAVDSRGTMNAIDQAIRAGIETHVFPLR